MSIKNVVQPNFIIIGDELRLRKYDGSHEFALAWYQDKETIKLVDGLNAVPYDKDKLARMYNCLDNRGELYFIEVQKDNEFVPIGDVTFWKEDMPIVIGDVNYRGKGIGKQVVGALIRRARELSYDKIFVNEIYSYNIASQSLFESAGFQKCEATENGCRYSLLL